VSGKTRPNQAYAQHQQATQAALVKPGNTNQPYQRTHVKSISCSSITLNQLLNRNNINNSSSNHNNYNHNQQHQHYQLISPNFNINPPIPLIRTNNEYKKSNNSNGGSCSASFTDNQNDFMTHL
jgi:hypothetical protein